MTRMAGIKNKRLVLAPTRSRILFLAVGVLTLIVCGASSAAPVDEAPADGWPMFRGCLASTGRSAATLTLPLEERWQRRFEKSAFEATPVVADGMIYVGDLDGTFYALALESGQTVWTFKTESGFTSAAAVSGDAAVPLVVVGDGSGVVRAFDCRSGKVQWEYETDGEISGGPTIVPDPTAAQVLIGSQDASLSCLSLADGKLLWKHSIGDQIRCSPTVAGGHVFLAGCDGKLHVLDAKTGETKGAVPIDGPTGTTPAAVGDCVFFGTEGGSFFAIDFHKNSLAWKGQATAKGQAYRSSAAIADGVAIVGSRGKAIEAFSLLDGSPAWRTPTRGRVDASPVVVMAEIPDAPRALGKPSSCKTSLIAIVGDSAGKIIALHAADGALAWEFDAGSGFSASPAVAAGQLVMASDDGTIWCFQQPQADPKRSSGSVLPQSFPALPSDPL